MPAKRRSGSVFMRKTEYAVPMMVVQIAKLGLGISCAFKQKMHHSAPN